MHLFVLVKSVVSHSCVELCILGGMSVWVYVLREAGHMYGPE